MTRNSWVLLCQAACCFWWWFQWFSGEHLDFMWCLRKYDVFLMGALGRKNRIDTMWFRSSMVHDLTKGLRFLSAWNYGWLLSGDQTDGIVLVDCPYLVDMFLIFIFSLFPRNFPEGSHPFHVKAIFSRLFPYKFPYIYRAIWIHTFPWFSPYLSSIFAVFSHLLAKRAAPGRHGLGAGGGWHHRAGPGVAFFMDESSERNLIIWVNIWHLIWEYLWYFNIVMG